MKSLLRGLAIICFTLLIAACATSKYAVKYTYHEPATPEGRACVVQCKVTRQHCSQSCRREQSTCIAQVGEENAESCMHKCACEYHYKSCFQMCGGRATPQRFCIAGCG